jgi:hypothetical protein
VFRANSVELWFGQDRERVGRYGRGLGLLYRHGVVHERSWTGEGAWACTAGCGCANWREPGVSAAVKHVEPLLLPMI